MPSYKATAIAHPNIALIKYWGNRDDQLRIPTNGSISMNLEGLHATTQITFKPELTHDLLQLNGDWVTGLTLDRVSSFLDVVCLLVGKRIYAEVISQNNFASSVGIASSAAAFAALSLSATNALGLNISRVELSRLARKGSGSACRSIPPGFVEWQAGETDLDSYAFSIAPPTHWNLVDCITVISQTPKQVGSTEGHVLASTSPIQSTRVSDAPRRLDICRQAILNRDFDALAEVVELDSNLMHSVMMTSNPKLIYWEPTTLALMKSIQDWRKDGLPVCYTVDAGPNPHILCDGQKVHLIEERLLDFPGVQKVLTAVPGLGAALVN